MSASEELIQLLENVIPDCRKQLQESHTNLERVAMYCEGNYVQAADKRQALEETKNYTTQSLASVAYQINTLATNFLHLLDMQMGQISDMESSINHLSQIVMIHKEKVARREIGELTANKSVTRPPGVKNPGIIFPEQQEKPVKYDRRPIDYSVLDDIGHGIKSGVSSQPVHRTSTSSSGSKSMGSVSGAPTTRPPTPPTAGGYASGSLRRPISNSSSISSPYRTPAPQFQVQQVQSGNYAPGMYGGQQPLVQQVSMTGPGGVLRTSGYAPGSSAMMRLPPVVPPGHFHLQHQGSRTSTHSYVMDPNLINHANIHQPIGNVSPPLPPPPGSVTDGGMAFNMEYNGVDYGTDYSRMSYSSRTSQMQPPQTDWVPSNYIEKVVAIYSYKQDKEDELTFDEGAVIYVVKKNDDGWWEGVMDGQTGLFPGNYVEPCI